MEGMEEEEVINIKQIENRWEEIKKLTIKSGAQLIKSNRERKIGECEESQIVRMKQ